ncbi:unnamed protein product [Moneuplotes crassus]|uniref:EamA domain-containing protein n=1 Tax=Euplotes crassus TaxID=5936 RepID=A0AAD1XP17_EUPCR|nr:unnamed protein product [Moneuplotes crassus]
MCAHANMIIFTKYLFSSNPTMNIFTLFLVRGSVFFLFNCCVIFTIAKEARWLLAARSIICSVVVIAFFYAISLIVATKATLILNLQPIFIIGMAIVFLGEKLICVDISSMMGAFAGVIMISFKEDKENLETSYIMQIIGIFICLAESVANALNVVLTKQMNKYLHFIFSPFYFSMALVIESAFMILIFPEFNNFGDYSNTDWLIAIMIGFSNAGTQILLSIATKYEDASVLAPLNYVEVIFVLLADVIFFYVSFTLLDIIGMTLISVCILIPLIRKSREHKKEVHSEIEESLEMSLTHKAEF